MTGDAVSDRPGSRTSAERPGGDRIRALQVGFRFIDDNWAMPSSARVAHPRSPQSAWAARAFTRLSARRRRALAGQALVVGPVRGRAGQLALAGRTSIGSVVRATEPMAERDARHDALDIIRREGRGALLPFQIAAGMDLFQSRSGRVVIAHARAGRLDVVLGDPIGPPAEAAAGLAEFVERRRRAHRGVAVYQASDEGLTGLAGAGFGRVFRIGQEAIVDLATFGLAGSGRANLRHTVTRYRRDGATVRWFGGGLDEASLAALGDQLTAVDTDWRRAAGPELGFTIASFQRDALTTTPVAVGVDGAGQVGAFVTFRTTGVDGGYVVDMIRRAPKGIPGAVETCIVEAAIAMRASGATQLSLGLAPIHGLDARRGPLEERAIRTAAEVVRRWYDTDGLAFFKAKFNPTWAPRYVAIRRRREVLTACVAILRLHLSRDGSLIGVGRNLLRTAHPRVRPRLPANPAPGVPRENPDDADNDATGRRHHASPRR